jgi:predicted membrane protein
MEEEVMALRYWFGSVLVVLGLGLLVDRVYPGLEFGTWFARLWPMAIILLGVVVLLTKSATWIGGIILLVVGGLLQIATLGFLKENIWGFLWPSFLILLGLVVVFRLGKPGISTQKSQDVLNQFILFSGLELRPQISNFRGGSVLAAFGGMDIDLRESTLAGEGAFLELTAAFGGIDVIIPRDWKLDIDGIPLFGGWSNTTSNSSSAEGPTLTIRCLALMGGIEIKN